MGAAAGHAALMDGVYRRQRHFYDVTRKYYLLGRDRLIEGLDAPVNGTVLEIGCGTGRNLVRAARAWPGAQFFGIDISAEMLDTAGANLARSGKGGAVRLAQGDATSFDPVALFGRPGFDRVFISYALSMIPDWEAAIEQAVTVLAPGGSLHIVDFGRQERLPRLFRAGLHAWLRRFHVSPRENLGEVLAHVAESHDADLRVEPLHRGYACLARLKRRSGPPYSGLVTALTTAATRR